MTDIQKSLNRTRNRMVQECSDCDTASGEQVITYMRFQFGELTPFKSGVALRLPPHSTTQARNGDSL
jgi:hypothetical protein